MHTIHRPLSLILFSIMLSFLFPEGSSASGQALAAARKEVRRYGIDDRSLIAVQPTVKPRQTLSGILKAFSVPSSVIHRIAQKSKKVFDIKSIRAGNPYLVLTSSVDGDAKFMIYEKTPVDFIVFKLWEPLDVYEGKKDVATELVAAGGVINHSLWESLRTAGCDLSLVEHLSDVFSCSVDFHHLQRGDRFAAIYERRIAADTPAGIKGVLAACLTHRGRDFYVFRHHSDSGEGYYDEHGRGIKKAFLQAPLKYTCITSGFNPGRLHPVLKYSRPHLGTDFAAPEGTPVMSVGDGRVLESGYHRELGNHITIRHNRVYRTQYLHLSRFAPGIKSGVELDQGQVIGYVGKTGLATGPHLEFRLWKNGKPVDIFKEDLPASEPLEVRDKEKFLLKAASLKKELDRLKNVDAGLSKLTHLKKPEPSY